MNDPIPTLEVNIRTNTTSAVVVLRFLGRGVVEVSTDARWCDKAAIFAALSKHVELVAAGCSLPPSKVSGSSRTAAKIAQELLRGQREGKLTARFVWGAGYAQDVRFLDAPMTDFAAIAGA